MANRKFSQLTAGTAPLVGGEIFAGVQGAASRRFTAAELRHKVVEANTAGSGAPNELTAAETGKVLTNEGTTSKNFHQLPAAQAGLCYLFACEDGDGIRIDAANYNFIYVADSISSEGGYIESTLVGSTIILIAINSTDWMAWGAMGTWNVA